MSYNLVSTLAPSFFYRIFFILADTQDIYIISDESRLNSKFGTIQPHTAELIGSSSFLQVTRTTIKARMSSNFGGIPPLTLELAALERLKIRTISLLAL